MGMSARAGLTVVIWVLLSPVSRGELDFTKRMRQLAMPDGSFQSVAVTTRLETKNRTTGIETDVGSGVASEIVTGRFRRRVFVPGSGNRRRPETVYCVNPHYAFRLQRRSEADEWTVAGFGSVEDLIKPGESLTAPVLGRKADTSSLHIPSLTSGTIDLTQLEELPGFEVVDENVDEKSAIPFVEFRWGPPKGDGLDLVEPVSATIWFDPSNHGLPTKIIETWRGTRMSRTIHTDCNWSLVDGRVKSAKFDRRFTKVGQTEELALWTTWKDWEYDTLGPDDFTLSAFGLPEPRMPRRSRWWLILFLGIVFFVGVALYARRASRAD